MDADYFYWLADRVWKKKYAQFGNPWVDRDDAVQQAVIRCWLVRDKFDPERGIEEAYFLTVVDKAMRQCMRTKRNQRNWGRPFLSIGDPFAGDLSTSDVDPDRCLRREFISWSQPNEREITSERHRLVLELHDKGWHNARIAREMEVDASTVTYILKKHGRKKNSGGQLGGQPEPINTARIVELRERGWSHTMIAMEVGCHYRTVSKHLRRAREEQVA